MMNRNGKCNPQPAVRPRLWAWGRTALFALAVAAAMIAFNRPTSGRVDPNSWAPPAWSYLVAVVILLGLSIFLEYRRRPALLRYWIDESGFTLTVRHQQTRAVLCTSHAPSLAGRYLRDVPLAGADLEGVDLTGADLQGADLRGANLRNAKLGSAKLQGAKLCGADLRTTWLVAADLTGADLRGACLGTAQLRGARLVGADLRGTNLVGRGSDWVLWDAHFGGAELRGALCNAATRWPSQFDPQAAGCVYEYGRETDLPIPHEAMVQSGGLPIPVANGIPRRLEPPEKLVQVSGWRDGTQTQV